MINIVFNKVGSSSCLSLIERFDKHSLPYEEDVRVAVSPMLRIQHIRKIISMSIETDHELKTNPTLSGVREHIERLFEDGLIMYEIESEWHH